MRYERIINKVNGYTLMLILLSSYLLMPFYIKNIVRVNRLFYYSLIILPIGLYMIGNLKNCAVSKCKFIVALSITVFVVMLLFVPVFYETGDNSCFTDEILPAILKTMSKCSLVVIWCYFYKRKKVSITFIELLVCGVCFYIFGTVIFLLLPEIKDIWIKLIIQSENAMVFSKYLTYATRFGFAGYSGFEVSFYVSICFPLVVFLLKNKFITTKKGVFYFLVLFVGSVFYARVGTIAAIIISIAYVGFYLSPTGRKMMPYLILIGTFAAMGVFIIIQKASTNMYAINWVFEPIINFFSGNSFRTASSDSLSNMYNKFKPTLSTILFGDGRWKNNGSFYMGVDVWTMRTIYFGGILFTILYYVMEGSVLGALITKFHEKNYRGLKTFLFSCLLLIILYEIKGGVIIYSLIICIPILMSIRWI